MWEKEASAGRLPALARPEPLQTLGYGTDATRSRAARLALGSRRDAGPHRQEALPKTGSDVPSIGVLSGRPSSTGFQVSERGRTANRVQDSVSRIASSSAGRLARQTAGQRALTMTCVIEFAHKNSLCQRDQSDPKKRSSASMRYHVSSSR